MTTANKLAALVNSSSEVVVPSGGINFGTSTDGSGTVTSGVMDDYEHGTFEPTILGETTAGTANFTNGYQRGSFVRIGNQVWCSGNLYLRSHTGSGNILVSGLPFTIKTAGSGRTDVYTGTVGRIDSLNYNESTQIMGIMFMAGTTNGRLVTARSGVSYTQISMDTDFQLAFNVFYEAA